MGFGGQSDRRVLWGGDWGPGGIRGTSEWGLGIN